MFPTSPSRLGTSRKYSEELLCFSGAMRSFRRRCALHVVRQLLVQLVDVRHHGWLPVVSRTVRKYVGLASNFPIPPYHSVLMTELALGYKSFWPTSAAGPSHTALYPALQRVRRHCTVPAASAVCDVAAPADLEPDEDRRGTHSCLASNSGQHVVACDQTQPPCSVPNEKKETLF